MTDTPQTGLFCAFCAEHFDTRVEYRIHKRTCLSATCYICYKEFTTRRSYVAHCAKDCQKEYVCACCDFTTKRKQSYDAHMRRARLEFAQCGLNPNYSTPGKLFAIIDTETTGLRRASARIVEIGIAVFDPRAPATTAMKEWSALIIPEDYEIPESASLIHGITTEMARIEGITFLAACEKISEELSACGTVIGHNLPYDLAILRNEIKRHDLLSHPIVDYLCRAKRIDTCQELREYLGMPRKLSELYAEITPKTERISERAHRVKGDILMTRAVYESIQRYKVCPELAVRASLPRPSEEQAAIIKNFTEGRNIIVDSVAGAGKTTLILMIAQVCPSRKILMLTFNRSILDETRMRLQYNRIDNVEAHSFHSFCSKYCEPCARDEKMRSILDRGIMHDERFNERFHALIIDEAQDITPLYFRLIKAIYAKNPKQICFIGDRCQAIYGFKGADPRYFILSPQILARDFIRCNLHVTRRCTRQMAEFVNALTDEARLVSDVDGEKVKLSCLRSVFDTDDIAKIVKRAIVKYGIGEVLLLMPSVQSSPYKSLINKLADDGINVYVPPSDDAEKNPELMRNKLVELTYHQAKGLERDCTIVLGFDSSYTKYYCRDAETRLQNPQYVAFTRARKELIVVMAHQTLKYAPRKVLVSKCEIDGLKYFEQHMKQTDQEPGEVTLRKAVTDLVRHRSISVMSCIEQLLKFELVRPVSDDKLAIAHVTESRDNCQESVDDITGIALPLLYAETMGIAVPKLPTQSVVESYVRNPIWSSSLTRRAAIIHADATGYTHKLAQITNWDWLTSEVTSKAMARIAAILGGYDASRTRHLCESRVEKCILIGRKRVILSGNIDWVRDDGDRMAVYEIKSTEALETAHFAQLALYALLVSSATVQQIDLHRIIASVSASDCAPARSKKHIEYYLYNIKNDAQWICRNTYRELCQIADILLQDSAVDQQSDDEFVRDARML